MSFFFTTIEKYMIGMMNKYNFNLLAFYTELSFKKGSIFSTKTKDRAEANPRGINT